MFYKMVSSSTYSYGSKAEVYWSPWETLDTTDQGSQE